MKRPDHVEILQTISAVCWRNVIGGFILTNQTPPATPGLTSASTATTAYRSKARFRARTVNLLCHDFRSKGFQMKLTGSISYYLNRRLLIQ
jgi:hypothetical protein